MKKENRKKKSSDDEDRTEKKHDSGSQKEARHSKARKSKSIFANTWLMALGIIAIAAIIIAAAYLVNRNSKGCSGSLCTASPAGAQGSIVAEVNGQPIYSGQLNKTYDLFLYMEGIPKSYSFLVPKLSVLNQSIMQMLIYDDATAHGYSVTSQEAEDSLVKALAANGYTLDRFKSTFANESFDYDFVTEYNRRTMVISKYLNDTILKGITVTDSEAQAYYDANKALFNSTEQIRVSHILVNSSSLAQQIIDQLDSGANFTELAKEYSTDPSVQTNGGDLGYFSNGTMIPEFESAAFALKNIGDYTETPVQSQYGYHIILLTGRKPAGLQPFAQVEDQIKQNLLKQKQNDAIKAYIQGLMSKADIKIYLQAQQPAAATTQPAQAAATPPKSDKPVVELFVMSYCPYGTQMEKGILPVALLFGDKIDFQVKFVNYAMHGPKEIKENLRQYCIETEQGDKYLSYLNCFLKANDTNACMAQAGVDTAQLATCTAATDQQYSVTQNMENPQGPYPSFLVDDADNKKYGVSGSPTLVINGVEVSPSRDSASLLHAVCSSFNVQPEECTAKLSSDQPSPGFGYKTTTTSAQADCTA